MNNFMNTVISLTSDAMKCVEFFFLWKYYFEKNRMLTGYRNIGQHSIQSIVSIYTYIVHILRLYICTNVNFYMCIYRIIANCINRNNGISWQTCFVNGIHVYTVFMCMSVYVCNMYTNKQQRNSRKTRLQWKYNI